MLTNELVTTQHLIELEKRFIHRLDVFEKNINSISTSNTPIYLRTSGVKKLLLVSDNKLKTMRESGEIPFSYIGATYYYPEADILEILRKNTIYKINKQDGRN